MHARCETPHVAVLVAGVIAIVYVSLRNFEQLITAFILGLWPFYALAVLSVIVLRFRQPQTPRTYRTWGYPVVPLVFVAAAILVLANSFIEQRVISLINVAISLSGIPVYFIWRALTRPKH